MQLVAVDLQGEAILAKEAKRKCDYSCVECGGVVRLRSGRHRQSHFYHLHPTALCRGAGKGMQHLQVQLQLQSQFGSADCAIEQRFPAIQRVADCVCWSKKIVVEVQCSPITLEEVQQRILDYQSQGFQVVWILHDRRYNKQRLTAVEQFLRSEGCYFTNIDEEGIGTIYDQVDLLVSGIRYPLLGPSEVSFAYHNENRWVNSNIELHPLIAKWRLPQLIRQHSESRSFCFKGDYLDQLQGANSGFLQWLTEGFHKEQKILISLQKTKRGVWNSLLVRFNRLIRFVKYYFIEHACR